MKDEQIITDYTTDNRDTSETELCFRNYRVRVNPWELVHNLIENAVENEGVREDLIQRLNALEESTNRYA
jgi:hypothetical protein